MELIRNENGKWEELPSVCIHFKSEQVLDAFNDWMSATGAKLFSDWFNGKERLRGTICEKCRWCDPTQTQCYEGHIQGLPGCECREEGGEQE